MDKQLKKILLNLLENDDDVVNAVKRIVDSKIKVIQSVENTEGELLQRANKIKELEEQIVSITRQKDLTEQIIHNQKKELESRERNLKDKEEEVKTLKTKFEESEKKKNDAINIFNDFKLRYNELDIIYNKYLALGDTVIRRMERILNSATETSEKPEIFIAYGIQENNIVALWESIATNYDVYDSYGKLQDLIDIFQYFLMLYRKISYKNIVVDWPNEGDTYDERYHTRTTTSNAVGKIQEVILPGFSIGKNIEKKALVIVR